MSFLQPLCPLCGFELAAKIGGMILVCVMCDEEFDLRRLKKK